VAGDCDDATPPLLFDPADTSCRQIVPTFRDVFAQFNRYQLFDEREKIQSIPTLVEAVEREWQHGSRRIWWSRTPSMQQRDSWVSQLLPKNTVSNVIA
jgi:hypothetical protein